MKIIFLNAWQGQIPQIKDFILDHIPTTDIFCFQEAGYFNTDIFCQQYLSSQYQLFTNQKQLTQKDIMVQATFVKKNFSVLKTATIGEDIDNIGLGLFTQLKDSKENIFNIGNIHGYPWPGDKQDNSDRINQSNLIVNFFKDLSGPKIIGGDFNLDFDIKSTQIFEENGYRSLIKDFKIDNTRNRLSWEQYENKQHFADHLFITKDIKVKNFTVPYNEISDHLPLILEIEI
ncbi:MAG: endonuclease/exonuclease/phosphatase family protein [Candidatus Shapirobacteria bacterium]